MKDVYNVFNGGINTRINPIHIDRRQGVQYENIDNSRGSLEPLRDSVVTRRFENDGYRYWSRELDTWLSFPNQAHIVPFGADANLSINNSDGIHINKKVNGSVTSTDIDLSVSTVDSRGNKLGITITSELVKKQNANPDGINLVYQAEQTIKRLISQAIGDVFTGEGNMRTTNFPDFDNDIYSAIAITDLLDYLGRYIFAKDIIDVNLALIDEIVAYLTEGDEPLITFDAQDNALFWGDRKATAYFINDVKVTKSEYDNVDVLTKVAENTVPEATGDAAADVVEAVVDVNEDVLDAVVNPISNAFGGTVGGFFRGSIGVVKRAFRELPDLVGQTVTTVANVPNQATNTVANAGNPATDATSNFKYIRTTKELPWVGKLYQNGNAITKDNLNAFFLSEVRKLIPSNADDAKDAEIALITEDTYTAQYAYTIQDNDTNFESEAVLLDEMSTNVRFLKNSEQVEDRIFAQLNISINDIFTVQKPSIESYSRDDGSIITLSSGFTIQHITETDRVFKADELERLEELLNQNRTINIYRVNTSTTGADITSFHLVTKISIGRAAVSTDIKQTYTERYQSDNFININSSPQKSNILNFEFSDVVTANDVLNRERPLNRDLVNKRSSNGLDNLIYNDGIYYASEGSYVYYSSPLRPDLFNELKYLRFTDSITGLAVCEYGILIFTISAVYLATRLESGEYQVEQTSTNYGCNNSHSIQKHNNMVIFADANGIYTTNGSNINMLTNPIIDQYYNFDSVNSTLFQGIYYLQLKNNKTFVIDFVRNIVKIDDYNIDTMAESYGLGVYAQKDNVLRQLYQSSEILPLKYQSPTFFGGRQTKKKSIESVVLFCKGTGSIEVFCDGLNSKRQIDTNDSYKVIEFKLPITKFRGYRYYYCIAGKIFVEWIEINYTVK